MHLFTDGIKLTEVEHHCLLHMVANPEQWLRDSITEKVKARRDGLINEWRPRLFADPAVTELPADDHDLCDLIMARDDYRSRSQSDAEQDPPTAPDLGNIATYQAVSRPGATVTLFASGIDVLDSDCACILAYVYSLDNWILGALMGHVNRGKKAMIKQYHPIILADPSVTTMPATEDGLITTILARSDYQRLGG